MITNALLEHPWLSPVTLVLLVVLGPIVGSWLVPRPKWAWSLTGLSLLPVALLTSAPVDVEIVLRCTVQWSLPTPGRVELMAWVALLLARTQVREAAAPA